MERVFKAKGDIRIDLVDDDGFTIEEDGFIIPKDSVWYFEEYEDFSSPVQLLNEDYTQWIEIDIDVLESGLEFEEIR